MVSCSLRLRGGAGRGGGRRPRSVRTLPAEMDGGTDPPASPKLHEHSTPMSTPRTQMRSGSNASLMGATRSASNASLVGGQARTRSYTRETAEPLAHALDATLSDLMDKKIAKFGHAFKNMENRLDQQQKKLDTLERQLSEEETIAREENAEIAQKMAEIHKLIDENVTQEQLDELTKRIGLMEHYVREEIESKLDQIKSMNEVLLNFSKFGEGAKKGIEDAKESSKKLAATADEELKRQQAAKHAALVRWIPFTPMLATTGWPRFASRTKELLTVASVMRAQQQTRASSKARAVTVGGGEDLSGSGGVAAVAERPRAITEQTPTVGS